MLGKKAYQIEGFLVYEVTLREESFILGLISFQNTWAL